MEHATNLTAVVTRWGLAAALGLGTLTALTSIGAAEDAAVAGLPEDHIDSEGRKEFRACRIAVFFEREATVKSSLSPAIVAMMDEQITFIMADTLFNMPALSREDGEQRIKFFEDWTLAFSRDIGRVAPEMRDPAKREATLLKCQPILWRILEGHIEALIQWRARAMQLEGAPTLYGPDGVAVPRSEE